MQALLIIGALLAQTAGSGRPTDGLRGTWSFRGNCPVSHVRYHGRLTISGEGPIYSFTWTDGATELPGHGLRAGNGLSARFGDDESGGLMHMRRQGRGWRGSWAYYGRREICTESWWRG